MLSVRTLFIIICFLGQSVAASPRWIANDTEIPESLVPSEELVDDIRKIICRASINGRIHYGVVHQQQCHLDIDNLTIIREDYDVLVDEDVRLQAYLPTYVVYVPETDTDDTQLEVHYSFKYRLSDERLIHSIKHNNELYLSYTGKFDFYWTPGGASRESSPVINRLNNPELHYQVNLKPKFSPGLFVHRSIDFALGHESNGQSIDNLASFNDQGVYALDYVSRGWDYLSLNYQFEVNNKEDCRYVEWSCISGELYLRSFFEDGPFQGEIEDEIFWDPTVSARIEDYDGLRLTLGKEHSSGINNFPTRGFWLTYRTGIANTGDNNSFTLNLRKEVSFFGIKLPLYLKYFNGYGSELVSYHRKDKILMLGLQLR